MERAARTTGTGECSQPDLRVIQRTKLEKLHNLLGGAEKIMCGSWRLKHEAVILKLPWRHKDFEILEL